MSNSVNSLLKNVVISIASAGVANNIGAIKRLRIDL